MITLENTFLSHLYEYERLLIDNSPLHNLEIKSNIYGFPFISAFDFFVFSLFNYIIGF